MEFIIICIIGVVFVSWLLFFRTKKETEDALEAPYKIETPVVAQEKPVVVKKPRKPRTPKVDQPSTPAPATKSGVKKPRTKKVS